MNEIGKLLKELRGFRSLKIVSELTNNQISHTHLSKIEKGEIEPSLKHLRVLSTVYKYPYDKLLIIAGHSYETTNKIDRLVKEFEELSKEEKQVFLNKINRI